MNICIFKKEYIIPYKRVYIIPKTIETCKVSIRQEPLMHDGRILYRPYINGVELQSCVHEHVLGDIIENAIADVLNWNALKRSQYDMFVTGSINEPKYEVLDREYYVWTADDKSCWAYNGMVYRGDYDEGQSPMYNSNEVQPSYKHFYEWVVSTIKE